MYDAERVARLAQGDNRAEDLGATNEDMFFNRIDGRFEMLDRLRSVIASESRNAWVSRDLRALLAAPPDPPAS